MDEEGNKAEIQTDFQDSEAGSSAEAGANGSPDAAEDELARTRGRVAETEQLVADRDGEIAALKATEAELRTSLTRAIAGYKSLVLRANPGIVEELITGDTIEAIDESLSKARTLVDRVKHDVEARISSTRVPGGAPERTVPDLSALSPREKIQYAIVRQAHYK